MGPHWYIELIVRILGVRIESSLNVLEHWEGCIAKEWRAAEAPTSLLKQVSYLVRRVRFHIIRNSRIENVGKSMPCMVSNLRMIWKQTVHSTNPTTRALRKATVVSWGHSVGRSASRVRTARTRCYRVRVSCASPIIIAEVGCCTHPQRHSMNTDVCAID